MGDIDAPGKRVKKRFAGWTVVAAQLAVIVVSQPALGDYTVRFEDATQLGANGPTVALQWTRSPTTGADVLALRVGVGGDTECDLREGTPMTPGTFCAGNGWDASTRLNGEWSMLLRQWTDPQTYGTVLRHQDTTGALVRFGLANATGPPDHCLGEANTYFDVFDFADDQSGSKVFRCTGGSELPGLTPLERAARHEYAWFPSGIEDPPQLGPFPSDPLSLDFDVDGYGPDQEVLDARLCPHEFQPPQDGSGSNPFLTQSTPLTDDDGDGTINAREGCFPQSIGLVSYRAFCSGAWFHVVNDACGGYGFPPGWQGCTTLDCIGIVVDFNTPRGVWLWDPICLRQDTAAGGDAFQHCKGSASNYAGTKTPYTGNFLTDGYGWRLVAAHSVLMPQPFMVPEFCAGYPADADEDLVQVIKLCRREWIVHPDGDAHPNWEAQAEPWVGPFGDADDNNPQVPIANDVVRDGDHDGHPTQVEVSQGNSHPFSADSRPNTDDDGDGTLNQAEPNNLGFVPGQMCSGAFHVVAGTACWGYDFGTYDPLVPKTGLFEFNRETGQLWVFDAICTSSYDVCRASTERQLTTASTAVGVTPENGWGWRYRGIVNGPQTFTVGTVCDEPMRDVDGDLVPVIRRCERTVTVSPQDGLTLGNETFVAESGDPDDSDRDNPDVDDLVFDLIEKLDQDAEEAIVLLFQELDETGLQLVELLEAAQDAANNTIEDLLRLAPVVEQTAIQIGEATLRQATRVSENATAVADYLGCVDAAFTQYQNGVAFATMAVSQNPSVANVDAWRDALVVGAFEMEDEIQGCDALGYSGTALSAAAVAAADVSAAIGAGIGRIIENATFPIRDVLDLLGPAGDSFNRTVETALQVVEFANRTVQAHVTDVQELGLALLEQVGHQDFAALAQSLMGNPQDGGGGAPVGRGTLVFLVDDTLGGAVEGARVTITRDGAPVGAGNTSAQGLYALDVAAGGRYQYSVEKTGFVRQSGETVGPAKDAEVEVHVELAFAAPVPTWALPAGMWALAGLAGFLILRSRNKRRR